MVVVHRCISCLELMKFPPLGYICSALQREILEENLMDEFFCNVWFPLNTMLCYKTKCIRDASFITVCLPYIYPVCTSHVRKDIIHIPIHITTERTIEHLKGAILVCLTKKERDVFYKIQTLDSVLVESLRDDYRGALGRLQSCHLVKIFKLYKYVTRHKLKMFKAVKIVNSIKLTDFFRSPRK